MKSQVYSLVNTLRQGWRSLRTLIGDDAYERYIQHHACIHPGRVPLSCKSYFRKAQQDRWDKINRCC